MNVPELAIFDCDGVLVDSEGLSATVLARMLNEAGLATSADEVRREYQGLILGDMRVKAERALGSELPRDWFERFEREREAVFRTQLQVIDGVAGAIERVLAAGVRVCVASQGKLEKTRLSLALTGLDRLFAADALFSAHLVARGKPFPDLFLSAARTLGVEPARCVVIEDTPSGVHAAVAARMRVLGYCDGGDPSRLRDAGAEPFARMSELPSLLGIV